MEDEHLHANTTDSIHSATGGGLSGRLYSLVDALSDLITASSDLITQHLDLMKLELKEDIKGIVDRVVLVGAILVMVFFGYSLLLVAIILLMGWGWGIPGMAIAASALAVVHLGITIPQGLKLAKRIGKPGEFKRSRLELEQTKQWMNNQIENSSLKKPLHDNALLENPSLKN